MMNVSEARKSFCLAWNVYLRDSVRYATVLIAGALPRPKIQRFPSNINNAALSKISTTATRPGEVLAWDQTSGPT